MASSIPLVRAAGVAPLEQTLRQSGRYRESLFLASGLPASPMVDPMRWVSFHAMLDLFDRLTSSEGADFGCRTATPEMLELTGVPWVAVRGSRTIGEALARFSRTIHFHASHVFFMTTKCPGGIEIIGTFPVKSTDLALHAGHQQIAGMVSALARIITGEPMAARIRLSPHPQLGVEHLKAHLGPDVEACATRQLSMFIADETLALAFPWEPTATVPMGENLPPAASSDLSGSARQLIAGMLRDGNPSLDMLALAAGRTRRTMQRLLASEGTSFAELVDALRQDLALGELNGTQHSVATIASGVGYRNTSSLTRAVRRWTDAPPTRLRGRV